MHKNAHFDIKPNKNYLFVIFIAKILANIKLFIVNLHRNERNISFWYQTESKMIIQLELITI